MKIIQIPYTIAFLYLANRVNTLRTLISMTVIEL